MATCRETLSPLSFQDLPEELIISICIHLIPHDIITLLFTWRAMKKCMSGYGSSHLWINKLLMHYHYSADEKTLPSNLQEKFIKLYREHEKDPPWKDNTIEHNLFTFLLEVAKEGDIFHLDKLIKEANNISKPKWLGDQEKLKKLKELFLTNYSYGIPLGKSPIDYAWKHQRNTWLTFFYNHFPNEQDCLLLQPIEPIRPSYLKYGNFVSRAALRGHIDFIKWYAENHRDDFTSKYDILIKQAIRSENINLVRELLKHDKNDKNKEYYQELLKLAIQTNNIDLVIFIMEAKPQAFDSKDQSRESMLYFLAQLNYVNIGIIRLFFSKQPFREHPYRQEMTLKAAENKNFSFIQAIHEIDPCLLEVSSEEGNILHIALTRTPLQWSQCIRTMLELGGSYIDKFINEKDNLPHQIGHYTPLQKTIKRFFPADVINLLVESGANIHIEDIYGDSLFHLLQLPDTKSTSMGRFIEITAILINKGLNIDVIANSMTPLMFKINSFLYESESNFMPAPRYLKAAELFIQQGAKLDYLLITDDKTHPAHKLNDKIAPDSYKGPVKTLLLSLWCNQETKEFAMFYLNSDHLSKEKRDILLSILKLIPTNNEFSILHPTQFFSKIFIKTKQFPAADALIRVILKGDGDLSLLKKYNDVFKHGLLGELYNSEKVQKLLKTMEKQKVTLRM